ncbi:MAG: hypothetical protein K8F29_08585 [Kofleriaceae bacterium]|nr:hypothetical protein [Candidatus Methylomirabilis lanthanidiphila]
MTTVTWRFQGHCFADILETVELKALQSAIAAEHDALLPAILDRVFKGEL